MSIEGEIWVRLDESEVRKYVTNDQDGIFIGPINPETFCRMLAKIAHSYAVAEIGYGNFQPFLRKLIRGKSHTPNYWVGGDMDIPPPSTDPVLHDIRICIAHKDGRRFVIVSLRLFAFYVTPQYHIVVGEI